MSTCSKYGKLKIFLPNYLCCNKVSWTTPQGGWAKIKICFSFQSNYKNIAPYENSVERFANSFIFCPLIKLHICKCRLNDKKPHHLTINLADLNTNKWIAETFALLYLILRYNNGISSILYLCWKTQWKEVLQEVRDIKCVCKLLIFIQREENTG